MPFDLIISKNGSQDSLRVGLFIKQGIRVRVQSVKMNAMVKGV